MPELIIRDARPQDRPALGHAADEATVAQIAPLHDFGIQKGVKKQGKTGPL